MTYQEMMAAKAKNASPLYRYNPMPTSEALAHYDKTGSYKSFDRAKQNANAQAHAKNVAAKEKHAADIARLREVNARINELTAQIAKLKSNMAFEDKYKDNPYWQLAKKHYIDTGDISAIENFRTREEALIEAEKKREFDLAEAEKNRKNALEIAAANKAEQRQYALDEAMKNRSKAHLALKEAKASGVVLDIKYAEVEFDYWDNRVKKLKGITDKETPNDAPGGDGTPNDPPSDGTPNDAPSDGNIASSSPEWLSGDTVDTFSERLSDKDFRFDTHEAKEKFRKWWNKLTDAGKQTTKLSPTKVKYILNRKDKATIQAEEAAQKKKANAWWNNLSNETKMNIIDGQKTLSDEEEGYLTILKIKKNEN